jgi:hypothetical protein
VLQGFEATVEAYTLEDPAPGAVQAAVVAALNGGYLTPAAGLTLAAGKVIHCVLAPSDGTSVTTARVDNKDAHKVACRFTILTQTTRN